MIENEQQYRVTQEREKAFGQLVERLESGTADSISDEHPTMRKAKMDAARSVSQELREDLKDWESRQRPNTPDSSPTA